MTLTFVPCCLGSYSIFDKPHVIDPVTQAPIIADESVPISLNTQAALHGLTKSDPKSGKDPRMLLRSMDDKRRERIIENNLNADAVE